MKLITTALLLISFSCLGLAAQVDAPPGLPLEPIVLVADVDGKSPVTTLRVTTAKQTDRWVIRSDAPWLQVAPRSGNGSQQITIGVTPGALDPGQHRATLFFRTANLPAEVRSLAVTYYLHSARGVSVSSGNHQQLVINKRAGVPFEAEVRDALGNPLAGVPVSFETVVGVTTPATLTVLSDAEGRARFQPTALQYGAVEISAHSDIANDAPAHFNAVASGWVSTLAGDGLQAYGGDEGLARQAHLSAPFGMALHNNDLLVVDYFNHALRRIDLQSGTIHAVAGNGKQGFSGDGGPALDAVLNGPFGFALNPQKDIVIGDYYNNRIRAIDSATGTVELRGIVDP